MLVRVLVRVLRLRVLMVSVFGPALWMVQRFLGIPSLAAARESRLPASAPQKLLPQMNARGLAEQRMAIWDRNW
jgi:hypothetical protein